LKLASGMTNRDREKDLLDIKELIKALNLRREISDQLNAYVRDKYVEIWDSIRSVKRRYVRLWRNKFLTLNAKNIDEMATILRDAAEELARMRADGVILDPDGGTDDDYALLVTEDPDIAAKYEMQDERDYWGEPDDEESESNSPNA
jgi:PHP family Zn ribbon phosphoesterase